MESTVTLPSLQEDAIEIKNRMRLGNKRDTLLLKECNRLSYNRDMILRRCKGIEIVSLDDYEVKAIDTFKKEYQKFKSKVNRLIEETTYK